MDEVSRLENQLSQLTEQLTQLNTTTKEQFKQAKLGNNYNPFSSAFAAPTYSSSVSLDGSGYQPMRLDKAQGRFNPFTHNRFDNQSIAASSLMYTNPQDRIRSDTNQVSSTGRLASGVAEAGSGLLGMNVGSAAGRVAGSVAAKAIGGILGMSLGPLGSVVGSLVGGAIGGAVGGSAFRLIDGSNQRIASNSIHKYMMENSYRFMNPNQSGGFGNPTGAGFGFKDSRQLSRDITLMSDDLNLNVKTLMDLTKSFSEGDLMKGVSSTKEFSKKFKDLTETAKSMAYLLNESVEDAGKFMSDLQLRGFDMSKLTNQTAKMKNLSQFLGKDVSQVTQTAIEYASGSVAGTNMNFTTALGNQTYSSTVMNAISDGYLKRGDKSYAAPYNLIKNMGGPEAAANVFGKIMNSVMVEGSGMQDQYLMAGTVYDVESQSWKFDSQRFEQFKKMGLNFNDGASYAQNALISDYAAKMKSIDPNFQVNPDLVYSEYFSNRQSIAGSVDAQDQGRILKAMVDAMRQEAPEKLGHLSDKAILMQSPLKFDETSAELATAYMKESDDNFSNQYDNSGFMAEYTAYRKATDTGLVGKMKKFGAGISNAVAEAGMQITAPVQNLLDQMTKHGTDFLFGNKDFDYQKEFMISDESLKRYFGDEAGRVDPSKLGKKFYEEFEKSLLAEQGKGKVVSKILLDEVHSMAQSTVKKSSAQQVLSGEDYNVRRWTSKDGLSSYAQQNYDLIQQLAIGNKISDQTLGYLGKAQNMTEAQLKSAAPELRRLVGEYGGNETLAIAAYEKGQAAVDKALQEAGIDATKLGEFRKNKDFTEFNRNPAVLALSNGYAQEMEKMTGAKAVEWQGSNGTIQSQSQAMIPAAGNDSRALLMGAIELNAAGVPSASGDSVLDARLKMLGIQTTDATSKAEKETLVSATESAYQSNIRNLEQYLFWGENDEFMKLSKEERDQTIGAYYSSLAGKEKITDRDKKLVKILSSNYDAVSNGEKFNASNSDTVISGEAETAYGKINSKSIKEITDEATKKDSDRYNAAQKNQKELSGWINSLELEGKTPKEAAEIKNEISRAIYSGDSEKLEALGEKYKIQMGPMSAFRNIVNQKDENGVPIVSFDPEAIKGEHTERAEILAKEVKANYAATQGLLSDLNFSPEAIAAMSLTPDQLETTGLQGVETSRRGIMDVAANAISSLTPEELTKLLRNGNFSEEELLALQGDANNKGFLTQSKDGSFSFTEGMNTREAAVRIAEYGIHQPEYGTGKDAENKEQTVKKELGEATGDLLTTAEKTTTVMIQGTKVLQDRMDQLAKQLGVPVPATSSSSAPSTGVGSQRGIGD